MKKRLKTRTMVGYIPIHRSTDYGGRILPDTRDGDLIYEDRQECEDDCAGDDNFVAVATVTWEEKI